MSLTNLRLSDFKRIAKLLTRKDSILRVLSAIDQELGRFDTSTPGSNGSKGARRGRPPGAKKSVAKAGAKRGAGRRSRSRRGALKEQIIAILKGAGKQGVHVKEIVSQTGAKDPNVRVWFYATGKKIKNIKQVAPATYAWVD